MVRRRTKKLTERFVEPYRIKKIVSSNIVELKLPNIVKIHPIVNIKGIAYSSLDNLVWISII